MMIINFCIVVLVLLIMISLNHLLKTLVLIETSMVCVLFLFFFMNVDCLKMMFLLVLAMAALEAGVGFTLLVKLLRIYKSPSSIFMLNV